MSNTELLTLRSQLKTIEEVVSSNFYNLGDKFFEQLVLELSDRLNADYTFVGELNSDSSKVETISLAGKQGILDNFTYNLKDTPCDLLTNQPACSYSQDVCLLFSKDQLLVDMGIEAYVGVTLFNSKFIPTGILVCLFKNKIENTAFIELLLMTFASRAGAELEHIKLYNKLERNKIKLLKKEEEEKKQANELAYAKERIAFQKESLAKEKELNELKSKFVSMTSHEFRTPLSAINFAAGSIKKYWAKMEPIMLEEKLGKIENQVLHMTNLLDDILIIGQADAGKTGSMLLSINLGSFIEEIINEVYHSFEESNEIELIDREGLKGTDIFIDEKSGRNIFINLLSNAVKFSQGDSKVTVELSSEKDYIIISITDFGIGISKSEIQNIFNPFVRGKNVDLIQGTGLGLSIVKEGIDVIKGEITVNSTVGKGSSFIVKIPKKNKKAKKQIGIN